MNEPGPAEPALPTVDLAAIVAAQQDQIDDLSAIVERQQQILDELLRAQRTARTSGRVGPADGGNGIGPR